MQILDPTIKKIDIPIHPTDSSSIQPNRTIFVSILSSNRYGKNSSSIDYELYVNMLSKVS